MCQIGIMRGLIRRIREVFVPLRPARPEFARFRFRQKNRPLGRRVGFWDGTIFFPPVNRDVGLSIFADSLDPLDEHAKLFAEFIDRFDSMRPMIDAALFEEYETLRVEWQFPLFESAADLYEALQLVQIVIGWSRDVANFELGYDHPDTFDQSGHRFNVGLSNWESAYAAWEG